MGGDAVIGGTAIIRGYARVFFGVITNGILQPEQPEAGTTAKLEPARAEANTEPTPAQKSQDLKDFFARVNKDFTNIPHHFQYGDGVLLGEYGMDSVWDTGKYDVILKEPEFTVTTTATANRRQGEPITKSATTDHFKLGDIEGLKLDNKNAKLTITLHHTIRTAYPDFESNWTADDVSWQVIVTDDACRHVVLSRNSRFDLNRVLVDKEESRKVRALHDFLKTAVNEYRKLTGKRTRLACSRIAGQVLE